jgi:hypothetical protein
MHWEKKICIRITIRRIVGAILAASIVANLVIVGAVFGAEPPPATLTTTATPTLTSALATSFLTITFIIPTSTAEEIVTTQTSDAIPIDTFTPTSTEPPLWIICVKRFFWPTYRIQQGDTLFSIALATGSTVSELISANCLSNNQIYTGQLLHVPRLPSNTLTATLSPTPTDTRTATPTFTSTNTATATVTDTLTATSTYTPTTTPTPTDTPGEPTNFLNPFVDFVLCSDVSNDIYFSVIPSDPQGIGSASVIYDISNGSKTEIIMQPDGDTYSGSGTVLGQYSTRDTVNYYFRAIDSVGNTTFSNRYQSSPMLCPLK